MVDDFEKTWPKDDLRRAFVAGAKWWEYQNTQYMLCRSDQRRAEEKADKRYPEGQLKVERKTPTVDALSGEELE